MNAPKHHSTAWKTFSNSSAWESAVAGRNKTKKFKSLNKARYCKISSLANRMMGGKGGRWIGTSRVEEHTLYCCHFIHSCSSSSDGEKNLILKWFPSFRCFISSQLLHFAIPLVFVLPLDEHTCEQRSSQCSSMEILRQKPAMRKEKSFVQSRAEKNDTVRHAKFFLIHFFRARRDFFDTTNNHRQEISRVG